MRAVLAAALLLAAPAPAAAGDRAPVAYTVVDGAEIPEPIAALGDPRRGAEIATDPERGGCLGCHALGGRVAPDAAFGAPLDGVGARRSSGFLRLSVVNYAILEPSVGGHAFYDVIERDAPDLEIGATRLTAQEIEDLVAWLSNLGA